MSRPPGPRLPSLVQAFLIVRDPVGCFEFCARRYGDIFTVRIPRMPPIVYFKEPALVKEILAGNPEIFLAGKAREALEPAVGGRSILILDGEEHARQRSILAPSFHRDAIEACRPTIEKIAEEQIRMWPRSRVFPLRPRMQALTLEVILHVVFGVSDLKLLDALRSLVPDLLRLDFTLIMIGIDVGLGPWKLGKRIRRLREEIDRILSGEIRRRRENPGESGDILSALVRSEDDEGLIKDQLLTALVAGHETTATALTWFFEILLRQPEALDRLEREVRSGNTAYLEAAIKESLRLRPPVADAPRLLAAPLEIGGFTLPAGWLVSPAIPLVHLNPAFFPDPESFRPERFLENAPAPHTWIPFGAGPRSCLGAGFALLEMRCVIPRVLKLRMRPERVRPEGIRLRGVTLSPSRGGRVIVEDP